MKRLSILGSTGSIGRQTLEVVRAFPERFRVWGLAAGENAPLLGQQIDEFRPALVSLVRGHLPGGDYRTCTAEEMAAHPETDLVVIATSGRAGLGPTLAAIQAGKDIALANKEVLVMAGAVVTALAREHNVEIRPIDSEHSALWQCLRGEDRATVKRLIITASGGPFRHHTTQEMAQITPEAALRHPTWQMGKKVTIDSATLMNKGMEIIEAHWLFGIPYQDIEVVVHPQSLIHSMVEFADGSIKAQLSPPDMKLPIQYALAYPERWPNSELPLVDWTQRLDLNFEAPDLSRFPCLRLAREAGMRGGTYPAALCAADEVAVDRFLKRDIGFLDISRLVEDALEAHRGSPQPTLDDILAADAWARDYAANWKPK